MKFNKITLFFTALFAFSTATLSPLAYADNASQFNQAVTAYENKNYTTAFNLFKSLAEQGNVKAQFYLGQMYEKGEGVRFDYNQVVKWYTLAAEQGDAKAQSTLGKMYKEGKGVKQDYQQVVKWYSLAAEQGDVDAQYNLGSMYIFGEGVNSDVHQGLKWYSLAAEQGNPDAQSFLGETYYVKGDYDQAVIWYTKAAQKRSKAAFNLANMYFEGKGVKQDYEKAVELYRTSGHVGARLILGRIYDEGEIVKQDYEEAKNWYSQAATYNNNAEAQFNLGLMYEQGRTRVRKLLIWEVKDEIIKRDYKEAAEWYTKAAEQGHVKAQFNLGLMYDEGRQYEKCEGICWPFQADKSQAEKWYTLAAEQGDPNAQANLGRIYYYRGNKQKAKELSGKACDNGIQQGCNIYRALSE